MEKFFTCVIKINFLLSVLSFWDSRPGNKWLCTTHEQNSIFTSFNSAYLLDVINARFNLTMCDVMQKIKVPESNVRACTRQKLVARSRLSTPCQIYMWYWITFAHLLASVKYVFLFLITSTHKHARIPPTHALCFFIPSSYVEHMAKTPTHVYLHA